VLSLNIDVGYVLNVQLLFGHCLNLRTVDASITAYK